MKKSIFIVFIIIFIFCMESQVNAETPRFTMSSNSCEIVVGKTETITIKHLAEESYFSIESSDENVVIASLSDSTLDKNSFMIDQNETISITLTAISEGSATIVVHIKYQPESEDGISRPLVNRFDKQTIEVTVKEDTKPTSKDDIKITNSLPKAGKEQIILIPFLFIIFIIIYCGVKSKNMN